MSQVILQGYGGQGRPLTQGYNQASVVSIRWFPGLSRQKPKARTRTKGR